MPIRTVLSAREAETTYRWLLADSGRPVHSWQVRPALGALRRGTSQEQTDSGLAELTPWWLPVHLGTIKGLEQKLLEQFGLPGHISSVQETHFTVLRVMVS